MGIVVESLDKAIAFFTELGMKFEGRAIVEGEWAGLRWRASATSIVSHVRALPPSPTTTTIRDVAPDILLGLGGHPR
jgi:hypothetical protein